MADTDLLGEEEAMDSEASQAEHLKRREQSLSNAGGPVDTLMEEEPTDDSQSEGGSDDESTDDLEGSAVSSEDEDEHASIPREIKDIVTIELETCWEIIEENEEKEGHLLSERRRLTPELETAIEDCRWEMNCFRQAEHQVKHGLISLKQAVAQKRACRIAIHHRDAIFVDYDSVWNALEALQKGKNGNAVVTIMITIRGLIKLQALRLPEFQGRLKADITAFFVENISDAYLEMLEYQIKATHTGLVVDWEELEDIITYVKDAIAPAARRI